LLTTTKKRNREPWNLCRQFRYEINLLGSLPAPHDPEVVTGFRIKIMRKKGKRNAGKRVS